MPRGKDGSSSLRASIVAAHQLGMGFETMSTLLGVQYSGVRKIIQAKAFKKVANLPRSEQSQSFISDPTGLTEHGKCYKVTEKVIRGNYCLKAICYWIMGVLSTAHMTIMIIISAQLLK